MAGLETWSACGLDLSGLEGPVESPLATILALHGGGYSAAYWDHPLDRTASLLKLGPSVGYRVVAIDRPGYGASRGLTGDDVRISRQAEVILEVANQIRCDSGALFTRSPRVALQWQVASGHNISLHRVARAYHLRAIAFFDETLARAGRVNQK
jgi:pimeloyl-ACP methyl ester carboxylesterase